jgi:hypothetical protein
MLQIFKTITSSDMKFSASLLALLPVFAVAATSAPPYVQVENIQAAGSGCPAGSLDLAVTNAGSRIDLSYSQFVAFAPADYASNKRKFCQVSVKVRYPPGWALTVASTDYQGYIGIDSGLKAEVISSYYFGGQSNGGNDVGFN